MCWAPVILGFSTHRHYAGGVYSNFTSTFVLDTASSPSCLTSNQSLCAPKIKVTIDTTCSITLANLDNVDSIAQYQTCAWSDSNPILGSKLNAKVDLAQVRWCGWI